MLRPDADAQVTRALENQTHFWRAAGAGRAHGDKTVAPTSRDNDDSSCVAAAGAAGAAAAGPGEPFLTLVPV